MTAVDENGSARAAARHRRGQPGTPVLDDAHYPPREDKEVREADRPAVLANLRATAEKNEETAVLYDQLLPLEPALAEEHRASAEQHGQYAEQNRDYAEAVAAQIEAGAGRRARGPVPMGREGSAR